MDTPSPTEQAHRSRCPLSLCLAVFIASLAAGLYWLTAPIANSGNISENLSHCKALAVACRLYAADHEGRFPVHLRELEPKYLSAEEVPKTRFQIIHRGRLTGESADWLYFGADFRDNSGPFVLIAAPALVDANGKPSRILSMLDTSTGCWTEAEYEQALAATIQRMKELPHRAVAEPSISDKAP